MSAFDLSPLATTADITDHVHLLRVEATWFCEDVREGDSPGCVPADSCEGHDASSPAASYLELAYVLEHPDECPIPACCCKWPEGPSSIDPNCEGGLHDACLNQDRCWTERELSSWGLETFDFPKATAVYRIQAWGSGPDYWGEYDSGIEFEPVEAVSAS